MPVWPDNLAAVNIFVQMSTQWRVGMAGAVGLDYGALPVAAGPLYGGADWPELFESIRVMEAEALRLMRKTP